MILKQIEEGLPDDQSKEDAEKSETTADKTSDQNRIITRAHPLLTSTGSGPDAANDDKVASGLAKMGVSGPIKKLQKVMVSDHLYKFASSLIFNAIERTTKAGSELLIRRPDPLNPVQ
jgi:hypothetical protein